MAVRSSTWPRPALRPKAGGVPNYSLWLSRDYLHIGENYMAPELQFAVAPVGNGGILIPIIVVAVF